MMKCFIGSMVLPMVLLTAIQGQSVKLIPDPGFVPYETYYISSIDLTTGASDVLLFGYRLAEESGDYGSVWVKLEFEMTMVSPALGISEPTTVIRIVTDPFRLLADLRVDNRQLTVETTQLYDVESNVVDMTGKVHVVEQLDMGQRENMVSSIMTSGRLPNGEYSFHVTVRSGSSETGGMSLTDEVTESIVITTPTSLNLIGPGGDLADTNQNLVYSPYPLFQWETEPCANCESFIRIAEFDPGTHSSAQEAIEDVTLLPLEQTEGWEPVGITTSLQYPAIAPELRPGEVYLWQVRKDLPTTVGTESYQSPIYAFKIADLLAPPEEVFESLHPVLQRLMEVLGESQFNAYFGSGGSLQGYSPSGIYEINGVQVSAEAVYQLMNQFMDQSATIVNISVE